LTTLSPESQGIGRNAWLLRLGSSLTMTAMATRKSYLRKILEAKTTNGHTKTGNDGRSPLQNVTRPKKTKQNKTVQKDSKHFRSAHNLSLSLSLSLSIFPYCLFRFFHEAKAKAQISQQQEEISAIGHKPREFRCTKTWEKASAVNDIRVDMIIT
jgi:hypothetical protein